jgi:hypothetical protein
MKNKRSSKLKSLLATSRGTGSELFDVTLTFPDDILTKLVRIAKAIMFA